MFSVRDFHTYMLQLVYMWLCMEWYSAQVSHDIVVWFSKQSCMLW